MFIYVTDIESRDNLIKSGFTLIKSNDEDAVWVFANNSQLKFDTLSSKCIISDVLSF